MKTSSLNNTFPYESPYWSNDSTLNTNDTNISTNTDMKNIGYSTIPLTEVRFCLDTITNCLQEKKEAINLKILLNNKSTTIYTRANLQIGSLALFHKHQIILIVMIGDIILEIF